MNFKTNPLDDIFIDIYYESSAICQNKLRFGKLKFVNFTI